MRSSSPVLWVQRSAAGLGLVCAVTLAGAAPVFGGIDLADFAFDITTYDTGSTTGGFGDATASGTSNGIGWSISPTNIAAGLTTTNGTFGFSGLLPGPTDRLHISSDFTLTFDTPLSALLVVMSNDNQVFESLDLNLVPALVQGLDVTGTQLKFIHPTQGGLALFTGLNTAQVSFFNRDGLGDGFNFAFHALPATVASPIPEPATVPLVAVALAAGAWARRRRPAASAGLRG